MTLPPQQIPPLPKVKVATKGGNKKKGTKYLDELLSKTFKKEYFNE